MGYTQERVIASGACEVEIGHLLELGGGNFVKYPEGGTTSVYHKVKPNKSGYPIFDTCGM